jgi:hypothetical protein
MVTKVLYEKECFPLSRAVLSLQNSLLKVSKRKEIKTKNYPLSFYPD